MEKFQEVVLKLAETHPNAPLTPSHKTLLRNRLNELFSEYQTPNHPPYSAMIERALRELNEEGGSKEDAICKFIRKEHHNLPWAHMTLLKHHLGKLCESGDIVVIRHKYMLVGENTSLKSITKRKTKTRKRKWRRDWGRERNRRCKKRNLQKGGKVEMTGKHPESEEQEQQLTEKGVHGEEKENKGMMSANGMEHSEDTNSRQPEIKLPETMKSDICSARSITKGSSDLELVPVEEFSESKRTQRQLRRWSLPALKALNHTRVGTSSKSKDHQSQHLKLSNLELPQESRSTKETRLNSND